MSFTPRIFGLLESEVLRGLEFVVSLDMDEEARTGWLGSSRARGRLRVAVINRSGVTIRPLKGVLAPADGVEFRLTPFQVDELPAFREARLATIEATLSCPAAIRSRSPDGEERVGPSKPRRTRFASAGPPKTG